MDELAVVVPTLNESDSIAKLLEELSQILYVSKIIIVDDQSNDGTQEIVEELITLNPRKVALIKRATRENGLSGAYLCGYAYARENGFKWIAQMDADGQHSPKDLDRLWEARNENTLIIGSRYCAGGAVDGWPWSRLLISTAGNLYFRFLHRTNIKDCTGGFKLFPAESILEIWKSTPQSKGFTFHAETTFRFLKTNKTIKEVPITFYSRKR